VVQETLRHIGEASFDGLVVGEHRFAAHVGGRCNQCRTEIVEQQMVQGTVGQHHADFVQAGRYRCGQTAAGLAARQHDGTLWTVQQRPFGLGQLYRIVQRSGAVPALRKQQRQRLVGARLAQAQPLHGGVTRGIAKQVVAADALDRNNVALPEG
jgi:uncharacterized iron-regulated membrane protein